MTPNQYLWAQAKERLVAAVTGLGYSAELAELMARELGSPKAIDRMTFYTRQAHPCTEEMLSKKAREQLGSEQRSAWMFSPVSVRWKAIISTPTRRKPTTVMMTTA